MPIPLVSLPASSASPVRLVKNRSRIKPRSIGFWRASPCNGDRRRLSHSSPAGPISRPIPPSVPRMTGRLLWLNLRRSPLHGDARQKPMDRGFILLLLLTSLTGLALLAGRDTSGMGILLALHLGVVMALFLTLPYGKFAHGFFRCAALLKWAVEKRRGKQAGNTNN